MGILLDNGYSTAKSPPGCPGELVFIRELFFLGIAHSVLDAVCNVVGLH